MKRATLLIAALLVITNCAGGGEEQHYGNPDFNADSFPILVDSDCDFVGVCDEVAQAIENWNEQAGMEVFEAVMFEEHYGYFADIDIEWYLKETTSEDEIVSETTIEDDRVLIEMNEWADDGYCYVMHELAHALRLEDNDAEEPNLMSAKPDCDVRDLHEDRSNPYFDLTLEAFNELYFPEEE